MERTRHLANMDRMAQDDSKRLYQHREATLAASPLVSAGHWHKGHVGLMVNPDRGRSLILVQDMAWLELPCHVANDSLSSVRVGQLGGRGRGDSAGQRSMAGLLAYHIPRVVREVGRWHRR